MAYNWKMFDPGGDANQYVGNYDQLMENGRPTQISYEDAAMGYDPSNPEHTKALLAAFGKAPEYSFNGPGGNSFFVGGDRGGNLASNQFTGGQVTPGVTAASPYGDIGLNANQALQIGADTRGPGAWEGGLSKLLMAVAGGAYQGGMFNDFLPSAFQSAGQAASAGGSAIANSADSVMAATAPVSAGGGALSSGITAAQQAALDNITITATNRAGVPLADSGAGAVGGMRIGPGDLPTDPGYNPYGGFGTGSAINPDAELLSSTNGQFDFPTASTGGLGAGSVGGGGLGTAATVAGAGAAAAGALGNNKEVYPNETGDVNGAGRPIPGAPVMDTSLPPGEIPYNPSGTGGSYSFPGGTGAAGAGTALSRILDGSATAADYASLAGTIGSTALGYKGAQDSIQAAKDMQNQYLALGAPSRARLEASYGPGFTMNNDPGFTDAMNTAQNTWARAAAAGHAPNVSGGNPYDSPGAMAESQKYLMGNLAYPALQQYRSSNAASGQLGVAPAASAGGQAVAGAQGPGAALSYGLTQATNPPNDYSGILSSIQKLYLNQGKGI